EIFPMRLIPSIPCALASLLCTIGFGCASSETRSFFDPADMESSDHSSRFTAKLDTSAPGSIGAAAAPAPAPAPVKPPDASKPTEPAREARQVIYSAAFRVVVADV